MREELSFKQLLKVLWQGKLMIVVTTILSLAISIFTNFFVVTPVYESKATVTVYPVSESAGLMDESIKSIISRNNLYKIFSSQGIKEQVEDKFDDEISVSELSQMISVRIPSGNRTSFIVSVESTDNVESYEILNAVIDHSLDSLEKQYQIEFEVAMDFYNSEMERSLWMLKNTIQEFSEQTDSTRLANVLLVTQAFKSLDSSNILMDELKNADTDTQIELLKIKPEIDRFLESYKESREFYEDSAKALDLQLVDRYISVEASGVPASAAQPNKTLNLALSVALGLMVGMFLVFFRLNLKQR